MVGGTPELSTAVWVGTADNTSAIFNQYGGNMYGANTPGSIWKDSLDRAGRPRADVIRVQLRCAGAPTAAAAPT